MKNMSTDNILDCLKQSKLLGDKIDVANYNFLVDNEFLNKNLMFLTLGGSYAYGTNIDTSDVDIRGISLNTRDEILLCRDHEETVNEATDTTIYTINKYIRLVTNCNPNTIELLGSIERNALYVHPYFEENIIKNKDLFLSKNAYFTFGGYATAQLRRLDNKSNRKLNDDEQNRHIIKSIEAASVHFNERYGVEIKDALNIDTVNGKFNITINGINKADFASCLNEVAGIIKDYSKLGRRNESAIERGKLSKHILHLFRLYLMCIDILEKHEINTYRENDHKFLMDIRNGCFLDSNDQPTEECFKLVDEYEKKMKKAFEKSTLPDKPDFNKINELKMKINDDIVKGNI